MGETETVICYMRNGHPLDYGRLPGCPKIPARPAEVNLHPVTLKNLRQDPRVIFITADELADREAELEAKAIDLKKRQAAVAAEDSEGFSDDAVHEKPDKKKRKRRTRE